MMSYGKDERHIDKHLWKLPIPLYDSRNEIHQRLAYLGRQQYELVAGLRFEDHANFIALRRRVRAELARHNATPEIAATVADMLD